MNKALFPDLIVNGETVTHADIAAEAQNHTGPKGKPGIAWRKAAHALAVRMLLLQEARKRGMTADCRELSPGRFETEEEALIRGLLETEIDVDTPTQDAVHAKWAHDPSRFRAPPLWEVSHILIACDPRDEVERDKTRSRAEELAIRATSGNEDFAELARAHSDCGSRANGGQLGQMSPGDAVPEFESALRQMADREVSASPVLTRHGWHVIRMDAVAYGDTLPFDAVKPQIAAAMEKAAWAHASRDFVGALMAKADISGLPKQPE
ncbi:peptidase [Pseudohalocynthiibacter aestuariivivens]|nr:peptidylprolyl isomerase [Pseudohalocynthiibacter aestuariivivens]QIE47191.1 peptidase [Pseudohalocynthiibacter aestuariivivens]